MKTLQKETIGKLDAKLWKLFSEYIRRRDALKFSGADRVQCITCPHTGHYKEFDCGHFQPRQHMGTKFDEKNNHAQCGKCNAFEGGEQVKYARVIDKLYGKGTSELLEIKARSLCKWMRYEYEEKIELYKNKLKEFKSNASIRR